MQIRYSQFVGGTLTLLEDIGGEKSFQNLYLSAGIVFFADAST